jgi:hypothetical protein
MPGEATALAGLVERRTDYPLPHPPFPTNVGNGKWEVCLHLRSRDKVALFPHILWFGPGGAHSLVPAASQERRREHDGMLVRDEGEDSSIYPSLICFVRGPFEIQETAYGKRKRRNSQVFA